MTITVSKLWTLWFLWFHRKS